MKTEEDMYMYVCMAHEGMGTDHYSMSRLTMRRSPSSTGYCYILPVDEL